MIVLDTQHVSRLQRGASKDAARLRARLDARSKSETAVTIITPLEQLRGYIGRFKAKGPAREQFMLFTLLGRLIDYYGEWSGRILPYDTPSETIYRGFEPKLIRQIGAMDARFAAIAFAHGATLLTANLIHFRQVPGLVVEDWLRE